MDKLQQTILEKGIGNVKIQFIGESSIHDEQDAICTLGKYWDDDNYAEYVHKIKCISEKPYINGFGDVMKNGHAYYMSDLESIIRRGDAKIL